MALTVSCSHIYAEHVPPPRHAIHYLLHICAKEGIHASRVKLYLASATSPDLRPAVRDELVTVLPAESEKETLHLNIDMPVEADRGVAAQSVGICTRSGRTLGKCTVACCSGSTTGLAGLCNFLAKFPEKVSHSVEYCCINFRWARLGELTHTH